MRDGERSSGVGRRRRSQTVCAEKQAVGPAPARGVRRLQMTDRLLQLSVAGVALAALAACALVRPDPSGLGTHAKFGFGQCSYLKTYGIPCASCGGTTAASWLMHGKPAMAFDVHPGATIVGILVALSIPFSLLAAARRRRWMPCLTRIGLSGWLLVLCGFVLLMSFGWGHRIDRYREWKQAEDGRACAAASLESETNPKSQTPNPNQIRNPEPGVRVTKSERPVSGVQ